jgi:hypothetical protein
MTDIIRLAYVTFAALWVAGCQTASLEDAAPKSVAVISEASTGDTPSAETKVIRRNPGFTSFIPIEKTAPLETKEFVATGASRTGEYPKFGRQPRAANSQLSDAEKLAAETEMTELLRNRASTPDARAQYEARLLQLRALAATHASDTQQLIEN